ncbi:MAG TPA: enoyl-CoA hydratase/isomerase family protein [Candidatus Limnocylindria bacterium]|nr:enoyl-CoA hydratase/isomerase family protein [Candidatus Limnocylindria bacterium]
MTVLRPRADLEFTDITYRKEGWVATVTFARPDAYNAYTAHTLSEVAQAFRDASRDDHVAVVVLTGAGDTAFCTGGDVKEYASEYTRRPRDYWKYMGVFIDAIDAIRNCGKPTIARVNGMAVGGGNEMNLACDLAIAADHARFRQVGVQVGSVAAGGATQWLPIVIGDRRARQMLMLCEWVDAKTALDWGLVNEVVPAAELDAAVARLAAKLLDTFPECMRYTKQQTNFWKDLAWSMTAGHARDWLTLHFSALEPYEGMTAFAEKRKADRLGVRERAASGGSSEYVWGPNTGTCPACGAKGLPEAFAHCGRCGQPLGR